MGSKLRHRPNPVKRTEPTVGATGVKTVRIVNDQDAFKMRILNEKWTKTEKRLREQCVRIKEVAETQIQSLMAAMQMEQQDFLGSASEVAAVLGINIHDETTAIKYDDEKNAFIIEPKNGAVESAPVQNAELGPVADDGDVVEDEDVVSEATEGMDAGQDAEVQP